MRQLKPSSYKFFITQFDQLLRALFAEYKANCPSEDVQFDEWALEMWAEIATH